MFALIRRLRVWLWPRYVVSGVAAWEAVQIESALCALPEFNRPVMSMTREAPNAAIIIKTGQVFSPRDGRGEILSAVRDEAGWHFEQVGIWRA